MVAALRAKGIPLAYLAFDGEATAFASAENIVGRSKPSSRSTARSSASSPRTHRAGQHRVPRREAHVLIVGGFMTVPFNYVPLQQRLLARGAASVTIGQLWPMDWAV